MSLPNEFCDLQARAASAQLRAEQSENREQVLQLEFIDMQNRAKLAEKSALDFKAIADHLQRQRAGTKAAHSRIYDEKNKDIADLQKQIAELTRQRDEILKLASKRRDEIESLALLLRAYGHDVTGTNPVTKDEQEAATNLPGAGKPDSESQLEACERDNDRLRAVIDGIKSSIDGIQTLVTLSE